MDYAVVDVETTGLDYARDSIIEIAVVLTESLEPAARVETYSALIRKEGLPEEIERLTGITEEMLIREGRNETEVMLEVRNLLAEKIVIAHNAPFDFSFLFSWGIVPDRFIDTHYLTKALFPQESARLISIAQRLGIAAEQEHRALSDALLTLEVARKLVPQAEAEKIFYHNHVVQYSKRPLRFFPKFSVAVLENDLTMRTLLRNYKRIDGPAVEEEIRF